MWLLTLIVALAAASMPAQQRPNVLFLLADDLRADAVGAFGGVDVHTPNLDALAARGVRLTQVYCMGSRHGAVCAPSRAMLLSGRVLTRAPDDLKGCKTLPEWLREVGYVTFATGKWHNGDAALRRAFPDARSVFRGGMCDHRQVPLCDVVDGEIVRRRNPAGFSTEHFTAAVIDFLQRHRANDDGKPFFAYVPFTAPHDPRDPPRQWRERLRNLPRSALPANFRGQHGLNLGPATMTVRDENLLGWPRDADLLREQLDEYRALVAHLDEQIGRILAALVELDYAADTLVVFTSDHGLALGSHGLLGKQSLYEHSMKAPCIVAGPGVPAGTVRDGLCYLLDLMPTVARAAGVRDLSGVDGMDLGPMLRGEGRGRAQLLTIYAKSQRALRRGAYKLLRLPQIDRTLMFDVRDDPFELRDLAGDPEFAEVRRDLERRLREAQRAVGDELAWTAEQQLPVRIDLTGKRWPPDRWQPQWIRAKYWH